MQQRKLGDFGYKITTTRHTDKKNCFIYDPQNHRAYFDVEPLKNDRFIVKKNGLQLYYREAILSIPHPIPSLFTDGIGIPLLKSNLQKAIRRCHTDIACQSALAIFQRDPIELWRRLGVIYIEDVCLQDSYSIVVWWMMADKEYKCGLHDQSILIFIIVSLCECMDVYEDVDNDICDEDSEIDCVRALHIRSQYGGMKGDMAMLSRAYRYYAKFPEKIVVTNYTMEKWPAFDTELQILEEAIDFHPFPWMLSILAKKTGLDTEKIKQAIWQTESCINIRKKETIGIQNNLWEKIEPHIQSVRYSLL